MKGKLFDMYVSKQGNDVFKYEVTGTPEEIAQFKSVYPVDYVRENTTNPIYFSTRNGGKNVELTITKNSNKVIIKSNVGERGILSQIKDADRSGNTLYAQAMAQGLAQITLAKMLGTTTDAPVKAKADPKATADAEAAAEQAQQDADDAAEAEALKAEMEAKAMGQDKE